MPSVPTKRRSRILRSELVEGGDYRSHRAKGWFSPSTTPILQQIDEEHRFAHSR